MDYFRHSGLGFHAYKSLLIHQALADLKGYAISCHKGLWEEALNLSYFHIMEHFDWDREVDLSHYATKIVRTIIIGKDSKETGEEVTLLTAMDKKSFQDNSYNPSEILIPSGLDSVSLDLEECMDYLVPMFVQDYKFFKSKKAEDRTLSYTGLFQKFSDYTVLASMQELVAQHGDAMEYLTDLKNKCHFRNFPKDRYKNDLDETIEYRCMFKDVLIYKRISGRASRKFYHIDLEEVLLCLVERFYLSKLTRTIRGVHVYCSLSGNLILNEQELVESLEREMVGAILARTQGTKVICYEEGKNLVISSSKDLLEGITFSIIGENFAIEVEQLVSRCVNK